MPRVLLLDAAGEPVAGNPRVPAAAASLPILLDGKGIGMLRLAPTPQLSGATDLAFARSQLRSALIAGIAVLLGALLLAFALARWLLAPVRALTAGTHALAAGDYSRRIATTRHDELGALARDFDHLAATLEQARDARRQWGADIAHELRTPLAILRGEIQALQDGVRAVTPQALESLNTECERLGHLVEDLYLLALADAGALDYRFEKLDLAGLVRESLDLQRPACADAGLELEAIVSGATNVRGDPRRLAQLLDNLLSNARRYTDAPGRIRVTVHRSGQQVRLVVEDTAPGVPATALPHLFERLYRVDASRTRASGGAGLGLAICRAIVDAHDGRIDARPSALGGLSVIVDLAAVET
jgi:two-component system sensor histidine kinase BaeS